MVRKLKSLVEQIGGALLGFSVLLIIFQVVMRYVFESPFRWTEELARYASLWGTLIVTSLLVYESGHIALDFFYEKLPAKLKKSVSLINNLLLALLFILLTLGGYKLIQTSLQVNQLTPGLGIPMWIIYIILPVSGLMMLAALVIKVLETRKEGGLK